MVDYLRSHRSQDWPGHSRVNPGIDARADNRPHTPFSVSRPINYDYIAHGAVGLGL